MYFATTNYLQLLDSGAKSTFLNMKSTSWIILCLSVALAGLGIAYAYEKFTDIADLEDVVSEKENLALNVIMTRSSVRDFLDKEVPDSLLTKILKAGMAAPTAYNKQPWEFVVVEAPRVKKRISELFAGATPVGKCRTAIVVCGDMNRVAENDTAECGYWTLDCAAATENMLIAGNALAIGSVWCGVYPDAQRIKEMAELLELPDNLIPFSVIAFGYEAAPAMPKDKWDKDRVYLNAYDTPFYSEADD